MNKHRHRIVFNVRRGQMMAVCESATGCVKASRHAESPAPESAGPGRRSALPALLTLVAVLAQFWGGAGVAQAQVVAYKGAPPTQQPTILGSSNGVPVVNVQSPSAAGVSRNTYSQFDVDEKGVVLNNSRRGANTHLAGPVAGNPWMAKGGAKVIVNEVVSSNPSKLNGAVEVAGNRAEVVIANPSGVEVNGGAFINASRATITTGKPNFKNGAIENYEVRQGTVTVGSRGLDASQADYTAILARAVKVNGAIQAKELKIVAGANQISADHKDIKPIAGTGPAPEYALDVSELGGMYAGKISMVGTEAGVGVRNAGKIVAGTGEIRISVDGKVLNPGHIGAEGDIQIAATKGLSNKGRIYARGALGISAQAPVENAGLLAAQGDLTIEVTGNEGSIIHDQTAYLIAGLTPDGQLNAAANLRLSAAKDILAKGQIRATADMTLSAPSIDLSGGDLLAYNIRLEAILNTRRARSRRASEETPETSESTTETAINLSKSKLLAVNLLQVETDAAVKTGEAEVLGSQVAILADTLDNRHGDIQGQTVWVVAGSTVDNRSGKIEAAGTLAVIDAAVTNQTTNESLSILNTGGRLAAGSLLQLQAANLTRDGSIVSQGDLSLALHGDYAHGLDPEFYTASGNVSLSFTGSVSNQGAWHTDKNLGISAARISNTGASEIVAGGTLTLVSNDEALANRGLLAGKQVNLGGYALDNAGGRIQGSTLAVDVKHDLDNRQGRIDVTGTAEVLAGGDLNNDGGRLDTGSLQLDVGGSLYSRTQLQTSSDAQNTHSGSLLFGNQTQQSSTASTVGEKAGITARQGDLLLDVGRDMYLQGGELAASGRLDGIVRGDIHAEGLIESSTLSTSESARKAWNNPGSGSQTSSQSFVETLSASNLRAGQSLSLTAGGRADFLGSDIKAGGDLSLSSVAGDLRITAQATHSTTQHSSRHSESAGVDAEGQENWVTVSSTSGSSETLFQGGKLESGGSVTLLAGHDLALVGADIKAVGAIQGWAGHDLSLGAQTDSNTTRSDSTSSQQTVQAGTRLAGNGLTLVAGANQLFASSFVEALAQPSASVAPKLAAATEAAPSGGLTLNGVSIDVGSGTINLSARNDITLNATWDTQQTTQQNAGSSGVLARLLSASKSTTTSTSSNAVSAVHGNLVAGEISIASSDGAVSLNGIDASAEQSLWIESGGATHLAASQLKAGKTLGIHAGGELDVQGLILNPVNVPAMAPATADAIPVSRQATLSGTQSLLLESDAGIQVGGAVLAGKDIQIGSQGNISLAGGVKQRRNGDSLIVNEAIATTLNGETVSIRGVGEHSDLALEHVEITSTGKTRLTATGDISLDPGVNYSYQHWTTKHSSGGWFSKKTTITEHVRESSTVAPSQIKAGEIEVLSGGDITLTASHLDSAGKTTLQAGRDIAYYAAKNQTYNRDDSQTKRSFIGFTYSKKRSSYIASEQKALVTELQSESDVLSDSVGKTTLEGTRIASRSGNVSLQGQTGLDLRAAKDNSHTETHYRSSGFSFGFGMGLSLSSGFGLDFLQLSHKKQSRDSTQDTQTPVGAQISGERVLLLSDKGGITLEASQLTARDTLSLAAAGDITLGAAEAWQAQSNQEEKSSTFGIGKTTKLDQVDYLAVTPAVSQLNGQRIAILSGGDMTLEAARLTAETDIALHAGGKLNLMAATGLSQSQILHKESNSLLNLNLIAASKAFLGQGKVKDSGTQETRQAWVTELITPGTVDLQSGGDMTLVAPLVRADKLNLEVGVFNGETINPQARLHLLGVTQSENESHSHSGKGLMWRSMGENGHVTETVKLPDFQRYGATTPAPEVDANGIVKGGAVPGSLPGHAETLASLIPNLNVPGGIVVGSTPLGLTLREQQSSSGASQGSGGTTPNTTILDLKAQTSLLAQQPGLEWLAPLVERPDVDWKKVQLIHDQWDYKHSGLSPEGGAIITAVVTYLTWGWGSGLATSVSGSTVAASSATGIALNAGVSALMSQATVSLINNQGDVGKTLDDLGKEETVKLIVSKMLTAWIATEVTEYMQGQNWLAKDLGKASSLERFASFATRATISAGVQSAVYGTPLEKTLETAVIDSVAQTLTSGIGDLDTASLLQKTLLHAGVQCLAAQAKGSDCGSGALGGATAELISAQLDKLDDRTRAAGYQQTLGSTIAGIAGLLVTKAAGGDGITGMNAAQMVDNYNRRLHPDQLKTIDEMSKKGDGKAEELTAVLCVLQNCDINGLSGIDANMREIYRAGVEMLNNNPALFKQLAQSIQSAGLLSGQFQYTPDSSSFQKDAFGLYFQNKVYDPYDKLTTLPKNWTEWLKGFGKGLGNMNPDLQVPAPTSNLDQERGALWAAAVGTITVATVSSRAALGKVDGGAKGEAAIVRNFAEGAEPNLAVNLSQQNKHIVGTNEYKTASQITQRSPLASDIDPQALVNQYAGTGQAANKVPLGQPGSVERITTNKIIGTYYENGVAVGPTTNFTIRYGKDGVHIIPARP